MEQQALTRSTLSTDRDNDPLSIEQIVAGGLCIGCGLCQAIAGKDSVRMVLTPEGRERPVAQAPLSRSMLGLINSVCPGIRVEGPAPEAVHDVREQDVVWGQAKRLAIGYAGDPEIRYRASTGGVLTALARFLLESGRVKFILHVAASKEVPFRSERRLSFDVASVMEGAGSRYGPAAPLIDFTSVLERGEPFALVAKPCDISAVRNLARHDPRVDEYMRYALTLVCGGASDLAKSTEVLDEYRIAQDEVTLFRYRGYGNPGPTRIETKDGRAVELTYRQMWQEEETWRIQPRCKICPDAIGEAADIAASDVWPGCNPTGEDEGFNGIIVRTERGLELFEATVAAGALAIDPQEMSFRDLDLFQPHQVRKKRAVWARYVGMRAAGQPAPQTRNLRLEDCARLNSLSENLAEARGARERAKKGRLGEPVPSRGIVSPGEREAGLLPPADFAILAREEAGACNR